MPKKVPPAKTNPVWVLHVVSSNIVKAKYHVVNRVLKIEFKNGKKYLYEDVSPKEFMAFTLAESQGKYLNEHIKPNKECAEA